MKLYGNKYSKNQLQLMAKNFLVYRRVGDKRTQQVIDEIQGYLMFHQGIVTMEEKIVEMIRSLSEG